MQRSGCPIGLALTGEVADCFMLDWDEKFKNKLKTLGIRLLLYLRLKVWRREPSMKMMN